MRSRQIALIVSLLVSLLLPMSGAEAAGGQYIVVLKKDSNPEMAARGHRERYGAEAAYFYRHALKGYAGFVPDNRVDELRRDPSVEMVSKVGVFHAAACPETAECLSTGVDRIDADVASGTGNGVDVAVLDTGINLDHPDLADNIAGGADCSGPRTNNFNDGHGHGSHVAGIIAALDNNIGVRGVAPQANLWAVKILSDANPPTGTGPDIVCGLDFVAAHADTIDIANISIEGSGFDDGACGTMNSDAIHAAICGVVDAGVTVVVAAGNGFDDIKNITPAAYDEVIAATALTDWDGEPCGDGPDPTNGAFPDDTFASFSSYATTPADRAHTLGAPGIDILSTWRDPNLYAISDGTSMAAPHIAGVAALYLQANPNSTPAQVMAALRESGEPLNVNAGSKCSGTTPSHTDPSGKHPEPVVCAFGCFLPPEATTPGVVRGIYWYLNNGFDSSSNVPRFAYGNSTDRVVAGDWNKDGIDSPGVVRGNIWYLNDDRDGSSNIPAFAYGNSSDRIVVGDWNKDGIDSPGVVRGNIWYLNNDRDGSGDVTPFAYGNPSDKVVVGDWNGDGIDSPGVVRNGIWYLNNDRDGSADIPAFRFGNSLDTPIVGDWDGDGDDDIGVRRGLTWFLRVPGVFPHISFAYGNSTDRVVVGDWDGENP